MHKFFENKRSADPVRTEAINGETGGSQKS